MRRIALATALLGVLAAAGCGGGGSSGSSGSAGDRGVAQGTFTVTVQNGQFSPTGNTTLKIKGGRVTSSPPGIDCGVTVSGSAVTALEACTATFALDTEVTLDAEAATTTDPAYAPEALAYRFLGWAGDCAGEGRCALSGNADRYVVAAFGGKLVGHENWTAGGVHGPKYFAFRRGEAGSLLCTQCHGANLQGQGLAVSCSTCHPWPVHGRADGPIAALSKNFSTGPQVTAECLRCHSERADEMLGSVHFTWLGRSTMTGRTGAGTIGKRNLVNNFCVSNASNEARCMQCHPSYSVAPAKDPATGAAAVNTGPMYLWSASAAVDKTKIDCLICHGNLAASKYMKAAAPFGQPLAATGLSCEPSCAANQICSSTDSAGVPWTDGQNHCRSYATPDVVFATTTALSNAARTAGKSSRANCGFCHFSAGGGDNVKMGDLGSALKTPTQEVDVHMGSAASYAPRTCASCHRGASHALKGAGLSIPADDDGRVTCTECHTGLHAPHQADEMTSHLAFIACQTCHIPTFSRTQFTKMDWDWSLALDKQSCQGLAGCSGFGTLTYPAGNAQTGTIAGVGGEAPREQNVLDAAATAAFDAFTAASVARYYDWKKGVAVWGKGVVPSYAFTPPAGGVQGTHETTARDGLTGSGTAADPFVLSRPDTVAPITLGWKIMPYKKMTGRSPAFADASGMITPHMFGGDSLWQNDLRGYPVAPNTLGSAGNPWTQAKADVVWTGALNYGAAVAGQLGAPVARAAGGRMLRDTTGVDPNHVVTVDTAADLPDFVTTTVYLVGAEAAFPSGVKSITRTGARQFTYVETAPYTANPSASPAIVLPALPATSTQFVAFYRELPRSGWSWANTVMYINLNHEVAPPAQALGCAACHPSLGGSAATSRMRELYDLGGTCADPMSCKKR